MSSAPDSKLDTKEKSLAAKPSNSRPIFSAIIVQGSTALTMLIHLRYY